MIRRIEFALLVAIDAGFEGGEVVGGQNPVDGSRAISPAEVVTGAFVEVIAVHVSEGIVQETRGRCDVTH